MCIRTDVISVTAYFNFYLFMILEVFQQFGQLFIGIGSQSGFIKIKMNMIQPVMTRWIEFNIYPKRLGKIFIFAKCRHGKGVIIGGIRNTFYTYMVTITGRQ